MDYGVSILALLILNEATLLRILFSLEGGKPSLIPSLAGKLIKRRYAMTVKKLVNFGDVNPIPAIPYELEWKFANAILDKYRTGDEIKLTEAEWIITKRWQTFGGVNAQQFRDTLDKWGTERIIERSNPNATRSTWILSRGGIGKLKAKVCPTPASPTAKRM